MNPQLVFWFFLIICFEAAALYSIKMYSINHDTKYLIISILGYMLIPIFLYRLLKIGEGIAMTNVIWNILSTIYGFIIGMAIFSEKVSNLQIIGSILGTMGIIMILWEGNYAG